MQLKTGQQPSLICYVARLKFSAINVSPTEPKTRECSTESKENRSLTLKGGRVEIPAHECGRNLCFCIILVILLES